VSGERKIETFLPASNTKPTKEHDVSPSVEKGSERYTCHGVSKLIDIIASP
jgi:hypothetical protein